MSRNPLTRKQAIAIYFVGTLVLSTIAASDFYWMRAHAHLPLWGEVLITLLPVAFVLGFMLLSFRIAMKNVAITPKRFSTPLAVISLCLAIYAMQHASKPLVLVSLYGFSRVTSDHLSFISTEKARPWVVSNGDHVIEAERLWSQMSDAVGATVFFSTFLLFYQLLPKRDAQKAD
jgi:hypothetical protein